MPHRVADFLRASTETFSAAAVNTIKSSIRPQQQAPVRRRIERFPSYDPSLSEQYDEIPYLMYAPEPAPVKEKRELAKRERKEKDKMLKSHKKDKTNHRISLPFGRSREIHENPHAALDWKIESPPIIFFGDAESSSGALVSGQMIIEVKDEHLEIENFSAALNIHVHQKKPFMVNCADCLDQYTELKKWTFLSHPTTLRKGRHQYPFSILLEGHLPASLDTPLVSIAYEFKSEVTLAKNARISALPIKFWKDFDVRILRMQYHIMLTECAGLGVSWDNEAPPVYSDVPPSPPAYPTAQPVDYEALEMLDALRTSPEPRA
ncbi:hypothetical protein BN1708_003896, partial [Verticillium longisporum]